MKVLVVLAEFLILSRTLAWQILFFSNTCNFFTRIWTPSYTGAWRSREPSKRQIFVLADGHNKYYINRVSCVFQVSYHVPRWRRRCSRRTYYRRSEVTVTSVASWTWTCWGSCELHQNYVWRRRDRCCNSWLRFMRTTSKDNRFYSVKAVQVSNPVE